MKKYETTSEVAKDAITIDHRGGLTLRVHVYNYMGKRTDVRAMGFLYKGHLFTCCNNRIELKQPLRGVCQQAIDEQGFIEIDYI